MEPKKPIFPSKNNNRKDEHEELTNLLLTKIYDLEERVQHLEKENQKLKNQNNQNNISFGQFISIGAL